ncbi:hypothetical protein CP8484711_1064A, partial [Chlamydia psittaci 84-8471/1]|jgi:signal transduction histidine kinase
MGIS